MGQSGLCKRCEQLARERDELAAQVGALRELVQGCIFNLGGALGIIPENIDRDSLLYNAENARQRLRSAIALDPPAALAELEARIREWEQGRIYDSLKENLGAEWVTDLHNPDYPFCQYCGAEKTDDHNEDCPWWAVKGPVTREANDYRPTVFISQNEPVPSTTLNTSEDNK